jgi:hypothetical protein
MQHVILDSWQGDRPNSTNRGLVKIALDEAATALASDLTLTCSPTAKSPDRKV